MRADELAQIQRALETEIVEEYFGLLGRFRKKSISAWKDYRMSKCIHWHRLQDEYWLAGMAAR
jgi:hypothetical protein